MPEYGEYSEQECEGCGSVFYAVDLTNGYCEDCCCEDCCNGRDHYDRGSDETERAAGPDYVPAAPRLVLPVLPDRPSRLISIEQEVAGGGAELAQRLHAAGFTTYDSVHGYHSREESGFCKVEEDGSVDAEVIYGKLDLSIPETAARLERALQIVKQAITDGDAYLNMRCGFHVHVDFRGSGMADVESLYHLWNHVEDTVFRLGSANWRCHRDLVTGNGYAEPTAKGLNSRLSLGSNMSHSRGALNLSNFLASRSYCSCGAFEFAAWEDCTCNLPKATAEFRVFNATANLRKVHAYTALCAALVAEARRTRYTAATAPAFAFNRQEQVTDPEATRRALKVIFEVLPLTRTEKNDLVYCAENSAVASYL